MMKLLMGTHSEIREFLINYLEDQLPALKKYQFWMHLLLCKDCGDYLSRYKTSIDLSRNYLSDPPPKELVNLTLKFLDEKMKEEDENVKGKPCPSQ